MESNQNKEIKSKYFKDVYSPQHNNIQSNKMSPSQWKDFNRQWAEHLKNVHARITKNKAKNSNKSIYKKNKNKNKHVPKNKSKQKSSKRQRSNHKLKSKETYPEKKINLNKRVINAYRKSQLDIKKNKHMDKQKALEGGSNKIADKKFSMGNQSISKESHRERAFDTRAPAYHAYKLDHKLGKRLKGSRNGFAALLGLAFAMMAEDDKKIIGSRILKSVSPLGIKQSLKRVQENHRVHKLSQENKQLSKGNRPNEKSNKDDKPKNPYYVPKNKSSKGPSDSGLEM